MNGKRVTIITAMVLCIMFIFTCSCYAFTYNDDVQSSNKIDVTPNVSINFDSKLSVATVMITIPTNISVFETKVCGGYLTISWEKSILSYSSVNATSIFLGTTATKTDVVLVDTKELSDGNLSVYIPQRQSNDFLCTMTLVMSFNVVEGINPGTKSNLNVSGKIYTCGTNSKEIDLEKTLSYAVCLHAKTSWKTTEQASCSNYGLLTQYCDICGSILATQQTPKTEHVYTQAPIERLLVYPSATEAGRAQYVCDVCGSVSLIPLPAGYVYRVYPENGVYYAYNIDTDKLNLFEAVAESKYEDYSMKLIIVPATDTDEGYALYQSVDGDNIYMTYKKGEEFVVGKYVLTQTVLPTCYEDGYNLYVNSITGDSYTEVPEELKSKGHQMSEWAVVQEPTCTTSGYKQRVCSVCGETERETLPSLGGHKYEVTEDVKPTCTEDGHKKYTCSVCGDTYTEQTEDMKAHGHSWSEWKTEKEPSCVDNGYQQRECTVCGKTEKKTLSADASYHKWSSWKVVEQPTSLEDGYMERECSTCHTKEKIVMPSTGYSYKETVSEDGKVITRVNEEEGIKITVTSNNNGKLVVIMENNGGTVIIDGTAATDAYFLYWHLSEEEYNNEVKEYADQLEANGLGKVIDSVKTLMYVDKEYRSFDSSNEIRIQVGEGYSNSVLSVWYVSSQGLRKMDSSYIKNKDGVVTITVKPGAEGTFSGGLVEDTPLVIVDTGKQVKNYTLPIVMIIVTLVIAAGVVVYLIVRKKMSSDETEADDYE